MCGGNAWEAPSDAFETATDEDNRMFLVRIEPWNEELCAPYQEKRTILLHFVPMLGTLAMVSDYWRLA